MTELGFLSPDRAAPEAVWRSPLERALAAPPAGIEDLSHTGKLDVRGDVAEITDGEIVRLTPTRALVFCPWEATTALRARLRSEGLHVVDVTAAYAGLRVQGQKLLQRLTDLDLNELPAVGAVAHIQGVVLRDDEESFRIFFPQEYSDYLAEVVLDAAGGLTP
jgi:sarcosine oxidase gamma subunit